MAEIRNGAFSKFKPTFDGAKAETELALFTCIEKVLAATHTKPHEVMPAKLMPDSI